MLHPLCADIILTCTKLCQRSLIGWSICTIAQDINLASMASLNKPLSGSIRTLVNTWKYPIGTLSSHLNYATVRYLSSSNRSVCWHRCAGFSRVSTVLQAPAASALMYALLHINDGLFLSLISTPMIYLADAHGIGSVGCIRIFRRQRYRWHQYVVSFDQTPPTFPCVCITLALAFSYWFG